MNNKQLGTAFEQEVCKMLADNGWWVHFISPNNAGAQPFDIIAVKNGQALAGDCKTSSTGVFPYSRLEDNQIMAFEKWLACGNSEPMVIIKYQDNVYFVPFQQLKTERKVNLDTYMSPMGLFL